MRGTRQIVLLEPNPSGEVTATGQMIMGEPFAHRVLAAREDRSSGAEGFVSGSVLGGEWETLFRVREASVPKRPDETWSLVDDLDDSFDIEQVSEDNSGPRPRTLILSCARRSVRSPQSGSLQ